MSPEVSKSRSLMHVFFDLDGTLTDSREGIVRCIQYALQELDAFVPSDEELTRYLGPPLAGSFADLLGTSDIGRIELALASYRHRYERAGMFENRLFPGIAETLDACAAAGHSMGIVSAKPHVYTRRVVEHFGLSSLFRGVYGPDLEMRAYTKESLIREACIAEGVKPERAIMVGDRAEDVVGAKRNGLKSVAVTWGYGDRAELEAAGPDCIVSSCEQMMDYIRHAESEDRLSSRRTNARLV